MVKRILQYFSHPKKLVILNSILIVIAVLGNIYFQVFCVPTFWAIILLIICFINTAFYPIISAYKNFIPIISFVNGISFCIFTYCIIFLEHGNLLGLIAILLFGLGFLALIPHFFVFQLLWQNLVKPKFRKVRIYFIIGILTSLSIAFAISFQFKKALVDIENFKKSNYETLNKTFLTEKILGMGIIYHLSFSEYDGWRPPKHEPILVIGMWMNQKKYPLLDIDLKQRVKLYKKLFPNKTLKFDCSCAIQYSDVYHNDRLWK